MNRSKRDALEVSSALVCTLTASCFFVLATMSSRRAATLFFSSAVDSCPKS